MLRRTRLRPVSFWSVPIIYAVCALTLGVAIPRIETAYLEGLTSPVNVESARAILSSVASGMIALTGIVFSLAFVMTQFSASAYSPRLVMWISQDPVLQHALGMFVATFLYAITALAWLGRMNASHVPFLTTWTVIFLLVASVVVFMRLMQRLSLLQVNRVLRSTGDRGRQVIESMYPKIAAQAEPPDNSEFQQLPITQTLVHHGRPVVIQGLDNSRLVALAASAGGIIEMKAAVGDTIVDGTPLLQILGGLKTLPDRGLRRAVRTGGERTFQQDPLYAIRLLVDVAIRALSPMLNDPTTAVQALDEIEDLLHRLGTRRLDGQGVRDSSGMLRVIILLPSWEDILQLAFDEIRFYGATSVQVMRRMKALLSSLAADLPPKCLPAILHQMDRVDVTIARSFPDVEGRTEAATEDRQGLGIHRPRHPLSLR